MMHFPLTVPGILRRAATLFRDHPIVSRRSDGSLLRSSYGECVERAQRLGSALLRLGLPPGSRVATLGWNHHRHLEAYFGVPSAGLVLHTLNPRLPVGDLLYIARHAGDSVLIVDEELLPLVEGFAGAAPFQHTIVCRDGDTPLAQGGIMLDYERLLESATAGDALPDPDEAGAAAMCYTSGTTGQPKGVVYSHRAIVLHSLACALPDVFALGEADVVLAAIPMFHANAWGLPYTAALVGATQVLPGKNLDASNLLALITQQRVTFTAGVPTVWLGLLERLATETPPPDLSTLRAIVVGGGSCPPSLIETFEKRYGIPIITSWGMTELSPVGTIGRPAVGREEAYAERARPGRALPFVETRISKEGRPSPWDGTTMGELEVRGPWVSAGYYNDPNPSLTPDGWFRTGDIATIDGAGVVEIRDRAKDLIKSGGEWISSVALENALLGHPAVAEAAVIAIPHPHWQERPLAIVVRREGTTVAPNDLVRYLGSRFPSWYLPERVEFMDRLPRTGSGKVLKQTLRERFAAQSNQGV